jgi:hypothetical protein
LWTDTRIILKVSSLRKSGGQTWTCLLGQGKTTDCCNIFSVSKPSAAPVVVSRPHAQAKYEKLMSTESIDPITWHYVIICYNTLL